MSEQGQLLLYQTENGNPGIQVILQDESVWLTQKQMAELFQKSVKTISEHIKNIYKEEELEREPTIWKSQIVQNEGSRQVSRDIDFYNLDMIISVGYRVNSYRGTQFRIWATQRLKEYIVKGFVMNDEWLANGYTDYFNELIERVRRIRLSEKNLYQKVTDIFATSMDYNSKTEFAHMFYASVQNKFHYAIHGHTAAELISERVNGNKLNLGLTNWKGEIITVHDATTAKNYLEEMELKRLELLVEQFLSFAELRSIERVPMYMSEWITKLDEFLVLNEKAILQDLGKVKRKDMEAKVRMELAKYKNQLEENLLLDSSTEK